MRERRRFRAYGEVQGVGFRAFVWREARRLEVGDARQVGQVDAIPGLTRDERMWICEKTAKKLLGER